MSVFANRIAPSSPLLPPFRISFAGQIDFALNHGDMNRILLLLGIILPSLGLAEEPIFQPNENLLTDGIPPIPAEIASQAGRYTEYRQALLASWGPAADQMLILTRFADTRQVHLVKFPGGARKQLTFFPDGIADATFPEQPANYFVYGRR